MDKPLIRIKLDFTLFYFSNKEKRLGKHSELRGDCSGLRGDCSGLYGNCSGIPMDKRNDLPNIEDWVKEADDVESNS